MVAVSWTVVPGLTEPPVTDSPLLFSIRSVVMLGVKTIAEVASW